MDTITSGQLNLVRVLGKGKTTTQVAAHFEITQQGAFQRLERLRDLELVAFEYVKGARSTHVLWTLTETGAEVAAATWVPLTPGGRKLARAGADSPAARKKTGKRKKTVAA